MIALLLMPLLLGQIPVRPSEGGTIAGRIRNADGLPAVSVRIAAVPPPGTISRIGPFGDTSEATMASLAVTDEEGRFRLESVPPGRYYIAAGRVDLPTYYPGTPEMSEGKLIDIEPGSSVDLPEFSMKDASIRPPSPTDMVYRDVPVQIRVRDGARLPIYSSSGQTLLWLTRSGDNLKTGLQMTGTLLRVPIPSATVSGEYRASVANLPEGYAVHSITFGTADVTSSPFKIAFAVTPAPSLTVELVSNIAAAPSRTGVSVGGRISAGLSVFLSGLPANLYADGVFEFRNVPPGRHAIVAPDGPAGARTIGASVIVGDRDVKDVRMVETPVLPFAPKAPATPRPIGTHAPGTVVPLASLTGRVLEEDTRRPVTSGDAILTSFSQGSFPIGPNGEFHIPNLFPGNYNLQIRAPGRAPLSRRVVIEEEAVDLEVLVSAL